jgi:putative hydrolase of the HAD superfamily
MAEANGAVAAGKTALILDFGGVVSRTMFEQHALTEEVLGLPSGSLQWRGPFSPAEDPLWTRMQDGAITERDYWRIRSREVGALVGEDWTDTAAFIRRARGDNLEQALRAEAVAAIRRLKSAGIKLAILSNELALFYGDDMPDRVAALGMMDAIVDATHTGILKPDPRAYRMALDALAADASEAVFVDDQPRNLRGAEAIGITAVAFDVLDPAGSFERVLAHFPQAAG